MRLLRSRGVRHPQQPPAPAPLPPIEFTTEVSHGGAILRTADKAFISDWIVASKDSKLWNYLYNALVPSISDLGEISLDNDLVVSGEYYANGPDLSVEDLSYAIDMIPVILKVDWLRFPAFVQTEGVDEQLRVKHSRFTVLFRFLEGVWGKLPDYCRQSPTVEDLRQRIGDVPQMWSENAKNEVRDLCLRGEAGSSLLAAAFVRKHVPFTFFEDSEEWNEFCLTCFWNFVSLEELCLVPEDGDDGLLYRARTFAITSEHGRVRAFLLQIYGLLSAAVSVIEVEQDMRYTFSLSAVLKEYTSLDFEYHVPELESYFFGVYSGFDSRGMVFGGHIDAVRYIKRVIHLLPFDVAVNFIVKYCDCSAEVMNLLNCTSEEIRKLTFLRTLDDVHSEVKLKDMLMPVLLKHPWTQLPTVAKQWYDSNPASTILQHVAFRMVTLFGSDNFETLDPDFYSIVLGICSKHTYIMHDFLDALFPSRVVVEVDGEPQTVLSLRACDPVNSLQGVARNSNDSPEYLRASIATIPDILNASWSDVETVLLAFGSGISDTNRSELLLNPLSILFRFCGAINVVVQTVVFSEVFNMVRDELMKIDSDCWEEFVRVLRNYLYSLRVDRIDHDVDVLRAVELINHPIIISIVLQTVSARVTLNLPILCSFVKLHLWNRVPLSWLCFQTELQQNEVVVTGRRRVFLYVKEVSAANRDRLDIIDIILDMYSRLKRGRSVAFVGIQGQRKVPQCTVEAVLKAYVDLRGIYHVPELEEFFFHKHTHFDLRVVFPDSVAGQDYALRNIHLFKFRHAVNFIRNYCGYSPTVMSALKCTSRDLCELEILRDFTTRDATTGEFVYDVETRKRIKRMCKPLVDIEWDRAPPVLQGWINKNQVRKLKRSIRLSGWTLVVAIVAAAATVAGPIILINRL